MPVDLRAHAGNDEGSLAEIKNRIIGSGEEPLDSILFNPRNWRIHPLNQQNALKGVLDEVGWVQEVIINKRTGHLVDGHLRCQLAAREGAKTIPVKYVDLSEDEEALVLATLDPIAAMAATDKQKLDELFAGIESENENVRKMMDDIAAKEKLAYGESGNVEQARKTLAERFIVPPFSVLDARQGYWQERKRAWVALGIQSELGRGEGVTWGDTPEITSENLNYYRNRNKRTLGAIAPNEGGENGILARTGKYGNKGKGLATSNSSQDRLTALQKTGDSRAVDYGTAGNVSEQSGTSIFDPVLCELAYRWWTPSGGHVLDPFAGGSVRGIVAAMLGYQYTGIDLSVRQIEANRQQADELLTDNKPTWIVGDSKNISTLAPGEYDFIFSCPPYADLEVYSDDPNDLSNMAYPDFKSVYHEIIYSAVSMLKPNRFACFVVGDVRDKKGFYRNFPAHTIEAFQDAGMTLYNEAVLVTAVGSLPIRVGKQFGSYRKLGKTHQNVLVFYKGDVADIKTWGDVECGVPTASEHIEQL
jgi:DNA modification methylase